MLSLISIGPGNLAYMLPAAMEAVKSADILIGYQFYLDQLTPLTHPDQQVISSQLGSEMARAAEAIALARDGNHVALVSSGDIGIYAMASPVFDILREQGWDDRDGNSSPEVVVYPGVSAVQAVSARVGAMLGHDFCTISLSDLLTPWDVILKRVRAAAFGDFVIGFYNPRSRNRHWQLAHVLEMVRQSRPADTPVIIARNVTRPDEQITLTTLAEIDPEQVDMFTLVLVGNSQSYRLGNCAATPRGYRDDETPHRDTVNHVPTNETDHTTYPIALNQLRGKRVIVVGGGMVATRKVQGLVAVGAAVHLISPAVTPKLAQLANDGTITHIERVYQSGDLAGATLLFAATDVREVNRAVADEAQLLGVLCNVADAPNEGDFYSLGVIRHEETVVAIGTDGASPRHAKQMRQKIEQFLRTDHNG